MYWLKASAWRRLNGLPRSMIREKLRKQAESVEIRLAGKASVDQKIELAESSRDLIIPLVHERAIFARRIFPDSSKAQSHAMYGAGMKKKRITKMNARRVQDSDIAIGERIRGRRNQIDTPLSSQAS